MESSLAERSEGKGVAATFMAPGWGVEHIPFILLTFIIAPVPPKLLTLINTSPHQKNLLATLFPTSIIPQVAHHHSIIAAPTLWITTMSNVGIVLNGPYCNRERLRCCNNVPRAQTNFGLPRQRRKDRAELAKS